MKSGPLLAASVPPILYQDRPLTTSFHQPNSEFNAQNSNRLLPLPRSTFSLHSTIPLLQLLQSAYKTTTHTPAFSVHHGHNVLPDTHYPPTARPRLPPHNISYYVLGVGHRQSEMRVIAPVSTAHELRVDNERELG